MNPSQTRREFVTTLAAGTVLLAGASAARSEETPQESPQKEPKAPMKPEINTYAYKVVDGREIKADVYGFSEGGPYPVVLWIHGGALIMASRKQVHVPYLERFLSKGYVVVSIDYRLAPETKLPDIIEDIQDAYKWVREKGPGLFRADPERIAVAGDSAGGYLTLMGGCRFMPRPKALVSLYGYGHIVKEWYTKPDEFYRRLPLVSREEALAALGTEPVSEQPPDKARQLFYLYCRQQGLWPKEVSGFDPETQPEAFIPYCPERNVTNDYPPTLLIHGDADTDVPHQQSLDMAQALKKAGVTHELLIYPQVGHGLAGASEDQMKEVLDRIGAFLDKHVKG